jgi:hypothetical protein
MSLSLVSQNSSRRSLICWPLRGLAVGWCVLTDLRMQQSDATLMRNSRARHGRNSWCSHSSYGLHQMRNMTKPETINWSYPANRFPGILRKVQPFYGANFCPSVRYLSVTKYLCLHIWIKVKIVPVIKHYAMSGSGGTVPTFLTSALDGGEWSVSRPCRFTPGERAHDSHWIGGWVGPRVGLNDVEKGKPLFRCRKLNPVVKHAACRYTELS